MTTTTDTRHFDAVRRGSRVVVRALRSGRVQDPGRTARRRLARRIASYPAGRGVGLIVR